MKKYDSYKDSGVDWIGEIPSQWKITKSKYCSNFRMGQTILKEDVIEDGIYPVYSATEGDHYFGRINNPSFILKPGDIVIPARGNSIGHIALVFEDAVCTQTTIANFIDRRKINSFYLFYFYKGHRSILFQYDATAIPQITVEQVKQNIILIPPLLEQTTIANYLDQKTSQIDDWIAKKERLIQLLEEERTAIINQAVTKGLDPTVPMKDSGIVWLGEIPEHWSYSSLKWFSNIYSGGTPSKDIEEYWIDGTIPWLNSGCVNQWDITEVSDYITEEAFNNSSAKWIPSQSLVIALAGQGKTKGMVAQVKFETTCNQSLGVIVPNEKINNRFLQYWLKNNYQNITS